MHLKVLKTSLIITAISAALVIVAGCRSKPTNDKSVDYKNVRSIPSLQLPPVDEDKKP